MIRALIALCLASGPAMAQDWSYGSFDNGSWFEAHVTAPDEHLSLHCGGKSPGGLPMPQTDEPMTSPDYTLILTLGHPGLGGPGNDDQRGDLSIASGTQGFRLPAAGYDLLNGSGWQQVLRLGDPLIGELRATPAIAVDAAQGRIVTYRADGLADALDRAITFCDARWAATGRAIPADAEGMVFEVRGRRLDTAPTVSGTPPPADVPSQGPVQARAEAKVRQGCGGGFTAAPDAFLAGDIDGDGTDDAAVWWGEIRCDGDLPRPFCGASNCAVDIVLSSRDLPEGQGTLYAQTAELISLSNGNTGLKVGGSFAACREIGQAGCHVIWYWDGSELAQLPDG